LGATRYQARRPRPFRWFIGLHPDEPVWNHSTFSKNRDRLIESDIAVSFLKSVLAKAEEQGSLPREHFSVDGTLREAWASLGERGVELIPSIQHPAMAAACA